jgi:predicted DNA-binding transcriptional regulator AlpA
MGKLTDEIRKDQLYRKKLMRWSELKMLIPMSRSTLWRKIKDGSFPRGHKVSKRITAWKLSEVDRWVEENCSS